MCKKKLYINSRGKKALVSAKKTAYEEKRSFSAACFSVNDNTTCLFLNTT